MKKLSLYVFLGLLWCSVGFAGELTINSLLQDGYKITKDETKVADGRVIKIITLTKGKSYVICAVKLTGGTFVYINTTCEKP